MSEYKDNFTYESGQGKTRFTMSPKFVLAVSALVSALVSTVVGTADRERLEKAIKEIERLKEVCEKRGIKQDEKEPRGIDVKEFVQGLNLGVRQ